MKIEGLTVGKVLSKNEKVGKDLKTIYYDLGIMVEKELGNISCTKDAYDSAIVDTKMTLLTSYNSEYKYFRILDCLIIPEKELSKGKN